MKQRYRVFLRPWGVYYCEDLSTKKQETLKTRDKDEAYRIVAARNENEEAPAFSLHLARVYWKAGDPAGATRTWQHVMDEIPKLKQDETRHRWLTLHVVPLDFSSKDSKTCSSLVTWPSVSFKCARIALFSLGQVAALAIFGNALTTRRSASYISASSSRNKSLSSFMFVSFVVC